MLKIYIYDKIQAPRLKPIINLSKQHNILLKKKIKFVNIENADLIIFLVNSRNNIVNINSNEKNILFNNDLPKIIIERLDSSVTWVRNIDKIKNLIGIIKNRVCRDSSINNTELFYGRKHYHLMHQNYIKDTGTTICKEKDLSKNYYKGLQTLDKLDSKYLDMLYPILWDFHSSPLGDPCLYFRNRDIDYNKTIDVFCVNRDKEGIQGWARKKAKNIINNMKGIKKMTGKLEKKKFNEMVLKSKICVACWGWGEWIHLDGSAMYAGAILIKPDTEYVKMDPDIYQNDKTYIPCKPDLSDLEDKIKMVLNNYDQYRNMIDNNRKMLLKLNKKDCAKKFWNKIIDLYNE